MQGAATSTYTSLSHACSLHSNQIPWPGPPATHTCPVLWQLRPAVHHTQSPQTLQRSAWRLTSVLAVTKSLAVESGQMTVPTSRPSSTAPLVPAGGLWAKSRCRCSRAWRTCGQRQQQQCQLPGCCMIRWMRRSQRQHEGAVPAAPLMAACLASVRSRHVAACNRCPREYP